MAIGQVIIIGTFLFEFGVIAGCWIGNDRAERILSNQAILPEDAQEKWYRTAILKARHRAELKKEEDHG